MKISEKIKKAIAKAPDTPGVYQMYNQKEEIIYVGKAKNVKKRIRSYFQKIDAQSIKTKKLVENVDHMSYISTNSELEALILETNLIKQERPKYNILMKDDKNYVYIKITKEDFPKIEIVRQRLNDHAYYFGPRTSAKEVRETLQLIHKIFPYRSCDLEMEEKNGQIEIKKQTIKIPCLDYYIKRCDAPCVGLIHKQEYQKYIDQIISFLKGKHKEIIQKLTADMKQAAEQKNFEKAAKIRDQIESVKHISERQLATGNEIVNRDVFAYTTDGGKIFCNLFQIREGKIIHQEQFVLSGNENDEKEEIISTSFIKNYYSETNDIPEEILLPSEVVEKAILEDWLKKISGHTVKIIIPQKGTKNKLIELCQQNANFFAQKEKPAFEKNNKNILHSLQKKLGLKNTPKRMECYDVSHIQGSFTVGSMVVFEQGERAAQDYRKFMIKKLEDGTIDDYQSLREILERRLSKLYTKKEETDFALEQIKKEKLSEFEKLFPGQKEKIKTKEKIFVFSFKNHPQILLSLYKKAKNIQIHFLDIEKDFNPANLIYFVKHITENFEVKELEISINAKYKSYLFELGFKPILKKEITVENNLLTLSKKIIKDYSFEKKPDLIIIDGGKGQLSTILKVFQKYTITDIDLISLAKKEEQVFKPESELPYILDKNSPELYLLQRIRDEAHRFALSFNKKLRKNSLQKSILDEIPGIGSKTKKKLLENFGSLQEIKKKNTDDLKKIVPKNTAEKITNFFKN